MKTVTKDFCQQINVRVASVSVAIFTSAVWNYLSSSELPLGSLQLALQLGSLWLALPLGSLWLALLASVSIAKLASAMWNYLLHSLSMNTV